MKELKNKEIEAEVLSITGQQVDIWTRDMDKCFYIEGSYEACFKLLIHYKDCRKVVNLHKNFLFSKEIKTWTFSFSMD